MSDYNPEDIDHLDESACWQLVHGTHVARLAVSVGGVPDIYPITTYSADGIIGFRTVPGTKLASLMTNHRVAVEWDGRTAEHAWSVVMHADAERQLHTPDVGRATPLIALHTEDWVSISPFQITGRRFRRITPEG